MTSSQAWHILAERAQTTVNCDDEQLVVCDALSEIAAELKLIQEQEAAEQLATAIRARGEAQGEFFALLGIESEGAR